MAEKHRIPHGLDHALARSVTRHALDSYRTRFAEYNPQGRWITDDRAELSFTVAGRTLNGIVEVLPREIDLELDVPFLFRPFRGKALEVIEKEIREWIDRAKKGEIS
ncbi:MAG: polyhydroxyalkanoic acid system family protein [Alphaproteobacteria bacterium]|nr:polyhydroxyalkanoic acid system family protein [Alphaproteobacteria bacterium]